MQQFPVVELEHVLKALANKTRLGILMELQTPQKLADIRVESEGRPISRQAIKKHLVGLEEIGAVDQLPDGNYVVRHSRLYEITERMRALSAIHGPVALDDVTRELDGSIAVIRPAAPHLVVVRGVREGATFELTRPDDDGGWTLGRTGDIALDHDQFVSGRHARIFMRDGHYFLADLATNRNGTMLNWRPMARGAFAELRPGDLIGMGMTRLVFRPGNDATVGRQVPAEIEKLA